MTPGLWLGRYRDLLPIRSRGSFHVLSVVRANEADAHPRRTTVVFGSKVADPARVRDCLEHVAAAHRDLVHPRIPPLVELGEHEGTTFVELDCDAAIDGADFLRLLADAGQKLTYGQGDALFTSVREAMQAAHAVTDPRTGRPYCLGRFGYANFLASPSGRFWVVGFGHNFPIAKEDDRLEGLGTVFQPPEIVAGREPTPSSDYVCVLMSARSLMGFCDLAEIVQRVLSVAASSDAAEAYEISRWFETNFISQHPEARPSMDEGIARSTRMREILRVTLDPLGLEQRAASIIAEADGEPRSPAEGETVLVAADGSFIEVATGERRKLGRANQQVLRAFLLAHKHEPGRAIGVWQLLEAGWPGEDPIPDAGSNRVYVAIARLRALGLRHVIERSGDGYRIAPGAPLKIVGGLAALITG